MVIVCGQNQKFIGFLNKALQDPVIEIDNVQEAVRMAADSSADALFLLPDYDLGRNVIEELTDDEVYALIELIESKKTKIYIENYCAFDARDSSGFLGCKMLSYESPIGRNSIRLLGEFKDAIGTELLQKRNGIFCPNTEKRNNMEILAEIRNCLGVHDVVAEDEVCQGTILGRVQNTVYTAMADLTRFDGEFALPYEFWKKFYVKLYSEILGIAPKNVEKAFWASYSGIQTEKKADYARKANEWKEALEKAVINAVNWHIHSGLLPVEDGTRGVYEMVRSFDLKIAKNIRGDSSLMTAALFMLAGKYFDHPDWQQISRNITDEMLNSHELQIREGKNSGLFKWFSTVGKNNTSDVYLSDTSRCSNSIYTLYKATGDSELKKVLLLAGEAILQWFNGEPLVGKCAFNIGRDDLESIQTKNRTTSSEFYEAPIIFLKNVYSVTGDERYRDQIIKTADALAAVHPNYGVITSHSRNFTLSRALAVYAVAQTLYPGGWTEQINDLLEYFRNLQHPCGGFADGQAYFNEKSLKSNMEFAIGFGPEHGNICDLMYCQNTMLYVLNILRKSDDAGFNRALADEMFRQSVDFLLNIQIVSDNKRISGGWMRAYDMDIGEYYGCDKDYGWGAYSILAGWMTGAIPMVFLDILGMDTMY